MQHVLQNYFPLTHPKYLDLYYNLSFVVVDHMRGSRLEDHTVLLIPHHGYGCHLVNKSVSSLSLLLAM